MKKIVLSHSKLAWRISLVTLIVTLPFFLLFGTRNIIGLLFLLFPYGIIKNVMNSLQDLRENRYNLITAFKSSTEG